MVENIDYNMKMLNDDFDFNTEIDFNTLYGIVYNDDFIMTKMKDFRPYLEYNERKNTINTIEKTIEETNFEFTDMFQDKMTQLVNFYANSIHQHPNCFKEVDYDDPINKSSILCDNEKPELPPEELIAKNGSNIIKINQLGELKKFLYGVPKTSETEITDKYLKTIVGDFLKPHNYFVREYNKVHPESGIIITEQNLSNRNFENIEVLYKYGMELINKDEKAEKIKTQNEMKKTKKKYTELTEYENNQAACLQFFFNGLASTFNHAKINLLRSDNKEKVSDENAVVNIKTMKDNLPLVKKSESKKDESFIFSDFGKDLFKYTDNIYPIFKTFKDDEGKSEHSHSELFNWCCNYPLNPYENINIYEEIISDAIENGEYKHKEIVFNDPEDPNSGINEKKSKKLTKENALIPFNHVLKSIYGLSSMIDVLIPFEDRHYIEQVKNEIDEKILEKNENILKSV